MKTSTMILIAGLIVMLPLASQGAAGSPNEPYSEKPSARMAGVFEANEKALLGPAFINGVNHCLRRNTPSLKERNENNIKMTANYGYQLLVELVVSKEEYEIIVTMAQEKYRHKKAQAICVKVANAVNKAFTSYLVRGTKIRDKTDRKETR